MGTETGSCGLEMNRIIKLNVGGVPYATSLATLTCVPSSYFSALFSGRWEQQVMQNGEVFLDRDGEVSSMLSPSLRRTGWWHQRMAEPDSGGLRYIRY